jgi:MFS family permease
VSATTLRGSRRRSLILACIAVAFAAADTYVVVLALPDMMTGVGLTIVELQRAAPIVSGFLLGYVAMLPLIGRISDLRGRVPVLVGSLVVFAIGSLITATAFDLDTMVAGRFLQGAGGGGLVPATLGLVADLWPPERRGLPLGAVGAVQELGSVLGPLYGAVVLAIGDWRLIFWLNLGFGVALAAALWLAHTSAAPRAQNGPSDLGGAAPPSRPRAAPDVLGAVLAVLTLVALALLMIEPEVLTSNVTLGLAYVPYTGDSRWLTPLAVAVAGLAVLFVAWELFARRPLLDLRGLRRLSHQTDMIGALLLGLALAGVVLAFATADPQVQVFSPIGPWLLAASALAGILFVWRQRTAPHPLVTRGGISATPAWGSLAVSFFVGASLIAALVDIPVFARVTVYKGSQLGAALVLVRFLVALPLGALAGGWLTRRISPGLLTAGGMALSAVAFAAMTRWGLDSLHGAAATVALVAGGFGFGLAIAPVNAAMLAATDAGAHGVASALLVVSRMIGMLVGISVLTTLGLRHFYTVTARLPTPKQVCGTDVVCDAYTTTIKEAALAQMHGIFFGAMIAALVAGGLALVLFRKVSAAGTSTTELLRAGA